MAAWDGRSNPGGVSWFAGLARKRRRGAPKTSACYQKRLPGRTRSPPSAGLAL